jgi:inner membrane protein
MDSLTHGLLGLAIGTLRRPDAGASRPLTPTDRAVLLACVIAAELPDIDYLMPAGDSVLHTLQAHRGISHSLVAAPVVALFAALAARLVYRKARVRPVLAFSLLAVVIGHLAADAWTGWGTRLLLPWSEARVTLDWTVVLDPLFTLPLLVGGVWSLRRRLDWRRPLFIGLAVAGSYLALRVAVQQTLQARIASSYPNAERVQVFPAWLGVLDWRYVAVLEDVHAAGTASLVSGIQEQSRIARPDPAARAFHIPTPTVREALAWARFPLVSEQPLDHGGLRIHVSDLRYHLGGKPTLTFIIDLDANGRTTQARLERGGSASELLRRWRERRAP